MQMKLYWIELKKEVWNGSLTFNEWRRNYGPNEYFNGSQLKIEDWQAEKDVV